MTAPILSLGETIVDLVCERPVASFADADVFVPHLGGGPTNVAVVAARCGAAAAVAGGVGADPWGDWVAARLAEEHVDLRWLARLPGVPTPVAFVALDATGSPDFVIYGDGIGLAMEAHHLTLEAAIDTAAALYLTSNTVVGERERAVTLRARELALTAGTPIVFDANLRLRRWADPELAVGTVRALCERALLVKANAAEARLLTGATDPDAAAEALCALGCRIAVVTLGPDGALVRGDAVANVPGVAAEAVDATGAGDAVGGVLLAALAATGFAAAAVAAALPLAVETAARVVQGFGAIDPLPPASELTPALAERLRAVNPTR